MKRTLRRPALVLFTLAAALAYGAPRPQQATPHTVAPAAAAATPGAAVSAQVPGQAERILALATTQPGLGYPEMKRLLEQSDALRQRVHPGSGDLGHHVRERLRDVTHTEAEARAWFERHRAVFGQRGFAESRHTVERLLAIEKVRAELGLH